VTETELCIRPANEASWADLQTVMSASAPAECQCQRYKMRPKECMVSFPSEERADRLRAQTDSGHGDSGTTSGLLAFLDGEPVGWCAVEPRIEYESIVRGGRVQWKGREEDRDDPGVWAITCFITRGGFRKRGIARALARAAVEHARAHGAHAVEGYPLTKGGISDEMHVGSIGIFAAAGLSEVSRPSVRRAVMRIDF